MRSAWRCWTTREIGVTWCAKRHVRYATAGIATPAHTASSGLTASSTIEAPTIIIALWHIWMTPQPMK